MLELGFRSQVLDLLLAEGAISEELAASIRGWRHTGFSVHNAVRVRGRRSAAPQPSGEEPGDAQAVAIRARSTGARLIHKVYEVDPLPCPRCNGPMHVIALIEDTEVIRRILEHLGRWDPRPVGLGN